MKRLQTSVSILSMALVFISGAAAEEYWPDPFTLSERVHYAHELWDVFHDVGAVERQVRYLIVELSKYGVRPTYGPRWSEYLTETYSRDDIARALTLVMEETARELRAGRLQTWHVAGRYGAFAELHASGRWQQTGLEPTVSRELGCALQQVAHEYVRRFGLVDHIGRGFLVPGLQLADQMDSELYAVAVEWHYGEALARWYSEQEIPVRLVLASVVTADYTGATISSREWSETNRCGWESEYPALRPE